MLHALHELVSLVHEHVNARQNESEASSSGDNSKNYPVAELGGDPVAKILCSLKPRDLQNMFLAMLVSMLDARCGFGHGHINLLLSCFTELIHGM